MTSATGKSIQAIHMGRQHIGARVTVSPATDEGEERVSGLIRWITMTSDDLTLAIEESEVDGAVEWTVPLDAWVEVVEGDPS